MDTLRVLVCMGDDAIFITWVLYLHRLGHLQPFVGSHASCQIETAEGGSEGEEEE